MAESTFDVLGTSLVITDMNVAIPNGSQEMIGMFNQVSIDLSGPDKDCLFVFGKEPSEMTASDGSVIYRYGAIQAKSQALIALIQQALQQYVQDRTGDTTYEMDIDGVYNCKDAEIMLGVAQEIRQTGLGSVDFWPLGPEEFSFLLTQSRLFQNMIALAIQEQGTTYGAEYKNAVVVVPTTKATDLKYVQADVPAVCAGSTPPIGTGEEGETPTCMPGYQYNAATGTCVSTAVQACPQGQVWDAKTGKCVAKGTAGTGATGATKREGDWWKWALGVGAGVVGVGGLYYWYTDR